MNFKLFVTSESFFVIHMWASMLQLNWCGLRLCNYSEKNTTINLPSERNHDSQLLRFLTNLCLTTVKHFICSLLVPLVSNLIWWIRCFVDGCFELTVTIRRARRNGDIQYAGISQVAPRIAWTLKLLIQHLMVMASVVSRTSRGDIVDTVGPHLFWLNFINERIQTILIVA